MNKSRSVFSLLRETNMSNQNYSAICGMLQEGVNKALWGTKIRKQVSLLGEVSEGFEMAIWNWRLRLSLPSEEMGKSTSNEVSGVCKCTETWIGRKPLILLETNACTVMWDKWWKDVLGEHRDKSLNPVGGVLHLW